jgi:hypothetical protein
VRHGCLHADAEQIGDFLVRVPFGHELQHLLLRSVSDSCIGASAVSFSCSAVRAISVEDEGRRA